MVCFVCHTAIRPADWAARYEWRKSGDDILVYGKGLLPLRDAPGRLVRVCHNKCFHVHVKQLQLAEAKAADPSAQPRPEQDWRHQETVDVEELSGNEGHRDHRGAGAEGS